MLIPLEVCLKVRTELCVYLHRYCQERCRGLDTLRKCQAISSTIRDTANLAACGNVWTELDSVHHAIVCGVAEQAPQSETCQCGRMQVFFSPHFPDVLICRPSTPTLNRRCRCSDELLHRHVGIPRRVPQRAWIVLVVARAETQRSFSQILGIDPKAKKLPWNASMGTARDEGQSFWDTLSHVSHIISDVIFSDYRWASRLLDLATFLLKISR